MSEKFLLSIQADTERDADSLTSNLTAYLQALQFEETPTLERIKSDPKTMDMGATLAIILGSTSITLLARGLADWIGKNPKARITVKYTESGLTFSADGVTSRDTLKLAEEFNKLIGSRESKP